LPDFSNQHLEISIKILQYTPVEKTHSAGEKMKRFIIEKSDDEFYTNHSGLALVGLCINRYARLSSAIGRAMKGSGKVIACRYPQKLSRPVMSWQKRLSGRHGCSG